MNLGEEVNNPDLCFHLVDGRMIRSVRQLIEAIKTMDQWVFEYHVNSQKNDFIQWIEYLARL